MVRGSFDGDTIFEDAMSSNSAGGLSEGRVFTVRVLEA